MVFQSFSGLFKLQMLTEGITTLIDHTGSQSESVLINTFYILVFTNNNPYSLYKTELDLLGN